MIGEPGQTGGDQVIGLSNEFAQVSVRKVMTRNGERLEISSRGMQSTIRLDPLELEALTWQPPDTFTAMLANPFGPSDGGG